jgi:hypothetical protein
MQTLTRTPSRPGPRPTRRRLGTGGQPQLEGPGGGPLAKPGRAR